MSAVERSAALRGGLRERVRAELMGEIVALGRAQLAEVGAAALSLRAIARELGMVSSAVYRYVPSRDHLLTLLIVNAYDELGAAAEAAEAAVERDDLVGRWRATCHAARAWALDQPAAYGLIFGTPVPGYAAPEDTIGPASRFPNVLLGILGDGYRSGRLGPMPDLDPVLADGLAARLVEFGVDLPPACFALGLEVWPQVFGTISFELFGHFHNVVDHPDRFFSHVVDTAGARLLPQASGT